MPPAQFVAQTLENFGFFDPQEFKFVDRVALPIKEDGENMLGMLQHAVATLGIILLQNVSLKSPEEFKHKMVLKALLYFKDP